MKFNDEINNSSIKVNSMQWPGNDFSGACMIMLLCLYILHVYMYNILAIYCI